jgi:lipoate---protein ligase
MSSDWRIEVRHGDAAALHADWPATEYAPARRAVAFCRVGAPAVVLGSTQRDTEVDPVRALRAGVAVARRRSGGGAVLVEPGEPLWVDVWLPATDVLWTDNVSRSFDWLGDAWVAALAQAGVGDLTAHRSEPSGTRWSTRVCFGGIGRGEVVSRDGRKVVGLAQRRTGEGAWFHSACALRWDPSPLLDVLAMPPDDRSAAAGELRSAAAGVADLIAGNGGRGAVDEPTLATALIAALPAAPRS